MKKAEIDIKWEREKLELETNRKLQDTKLKVYNLILKIDGELMVLGSYNSPIQKFDISAYKEKVRPILYSDYHLLDENVKKSVRTIDNWISKCEQLESIEEDDHQILGDAYIKLINQIENHYQE